MGLISFFVKKVAASAKADLAEEQHKKHEELIRNNWDEIATQIQSGVDIDAIAEEYYTRYQIPDTHTILYVCSILLEIASKNDATKAKKVLHIVRNQKIDAAIPPGNYLQKLSESRTVFAVSECRMYPRYNNYTAVNGLLVLTKAYLYFLEISAEELARKQSSFFANNFKERFTDGIENAIPGLDYLSTGWDVLSGMHEVAKDYFDEDRKQILAELLTKGKGVAIPLIDLQSVGGYTDKNNFLFLKVVYRTEKKTDSLPVFYKPKDDSSNGKDWKDYWKTMICTVAVAEGKILV